MPKDQEKNASSVATVSPSGAKVGAAAAIAAAASEKYSKCSPTLFGIPDDDQKDVIAPYLDTQSRYRYIINKQSQSLFSTDFRLHKFQTLVARGQQQIAEVWLIAEKYQLPIARVETVLKSEIACALEEGCVIITMPGVREKLASLSDTKADHKAELKVSDLLTTKCNIPVMDYAGEETGKSFKDMTAFQIPVIQNDTHMYRMMFLHYLPQQQARAQWEELVAMGEVKRLNYTPCLMTDEVTVSKQGEIYFRVKEDCLAYSVRTLYGEVVIDKTIPRDVLSPSSVSNESKSAASVDLRYIQDNLPKILQYASQELDTDSEMGTLMTRGRCQIERVKHRLQTFVNNSNGWAEDERVEYFCLWVGGSQRHLPPHVLQEYARPNRPFDPTPKFDESTLPRVPRYLVNFDGTPIYPLRIYKSVEVVAEADIKRIGDKTPGPHRLFLERKNDGHSKLRWNKAGKLAASNSLDTKTVFEFSLNRGVVWDLLFAGRGSKSRKLITLLLFMFSRDDDCDFGLGFSFGLMRGSGVPGPSCAQDMQGFLIRADLAAVTVLCKKRSNDDLELLIRDLYQPSPAQAPAAGAAAASSSPVPSRGTSP